MWHTTFWNNNWKQQKIVQRFTTHDFPKKLTLDNKSTTTIVYKKTLELSGFSLSILNSTDSLNLELVLRIDL